MLLFIIVLQMNSIPLASAYPLRPFLKCASAGSIFPTETDARKWNERDKFSLQNCPVFLFFILYHPQVTQKKRYTHPRLHETNFHPKRPRRLTVSRTNRKEVAQRFVGLGSKLFPCGETFNLIGSLQADQTDGRTGREVSRAMFISGAPQIQCHRCVESVRQLARLLLLPENSNQIDKLGHRIQCV